MNWIHPFVDGNGRTSRAVSISCSAFAWATCCQEQLPSLSKSQEQRPYYQALETADKANATGKLDLTEMERLLESYLRISCLSVGLCSVRHLNKSLLGLTISPFGECRSLRFKARFLRSGCICGGAVSTFSRPFVVPPSSFPPHQFDSTVLVAQPFLAVRHHCNLTQPNARHLQTAPFPISIF